MVKVPHFNPISLTPLHQKVLEQTYMATLSETSTMKGAALSQIEWRSISLTKKLAQVQIDIFLTKCKQQDYIPKGLIIINPLKSTYSTDYGDRLCNTVSKKLLNQLIKILYSKQRRIQKDITVLEQHIQH
ncbi:hypothetical protein JRQ81_005951 [Phrynocephalus forsythii]|uniref:Uncharacterized protein n=1 Tax=Phrynocephalus forsythii TaxID=171643 RepID=A0A9Q0Y3B1_9SAUR|nr:hypothetical protein JRQ81_005951 [Phrynocephalus forsythii]